MINFLTVFIVAAVCWLTMVNTVAAGGAAARRRPSTSTGRPTVQGPPINLGRQKAQAYIPPRTKSVNLPPVLPFEAKPEESKTVVKPQKPPEQQYPTQVLSSSNKNTTNLARASYSPSGRTAPSSASAIAPPAELAALFERFDRSSEPWLKINDPRVKAVIVEHYVDLYQQFGVKIGKPAEYYSNSIDAMSKNNPRLLAQPFDQVLRVVAILEYDYNSGESKDALAASILTDRKAFLQNKQRLGIK